MAKLKLINARKPTTKRKNEEAMFVKTLYYNELMLRMALPAFIISIIFAPLLAIAAEKISAGFPERSLWLSKTDPAAGEQVEIFTVIYNSSETAVNGKLVFTADGANIGEKQFDLAPGKTELRSVFWTAGAGTHRLAASIESGSLGISNKNAGEIEIKIANPPPPTGIEQGVTVIGTVAKNVASTSVPIISSTAKTVFQATESFRESGIKFAEDHLSKKSSSDASVQKIPTLNRSASTKEESTASIENTAVEDPDENNSFFSRLSQLASPAILFTFGSRVIFYPLLIFLLLGFLYLLGRVVNRRRY